MKKFVIAIASIVIFQGCRTVAEDSKTSGHFENSTASDLNSTRNNQTLSPEFKTPRSVLISNELLEEYKMGDFFSQILKSDVEKLYIVVPPNRQFVAEKYLKVLAQIHRVKFDSDIDQFKHKVEFVERKSERGRSVWIRDYAPLTTVESNNDTVLLDFNYLGKPPIQMRASLLCTRM